MTEATIPVPPLPTQQSIVSELDSLSKIIADCKETLKDYDALEQSIFYDMFGDPVKNDKGWEVKKLGEVCSKITDGSHNPPNGVVDKSPFLMYSSKNVTNQGFVFFEPRYLTFDEFKEEDKRTQVTKGDVFLVIVGAGVGKSCVYESDIKITLQRSVAVLKPNNKILDSYYLNRLVINAKELICIEAKGVAQKGIYLNQLKSITIPLPPLPLQQQFASKIEAIEKMKTETKKALQEAETLFNARMDYWFN